MRMIRPKYLNIVREMHTGYKEKAPWLQDGLAYSVSKVGIVVSLIILHFTALY